MADNTQLNLATTAGDISASKDVGGVKSQRTLSQFGVGAAVQDVEDVDTRRFPVKTPTAGTATRSSVNDSAASVTILADNANRKGAVITNDSSAVLYLALGPGPATATDYTVTIQPSGDSYPVPAVYTGIIVGIWATDPNDGGARVTELT